jgi:hypothetical protein
MVNSHHWFHVLLTQNPFFMKNLTLFLFALLAMPLMYAQTPQGINYQAVLRDGSTVLANTQVNVLLGIEDANVNILYEESHDLTTNEFGLINFVIGEGTPVIGTFDQIDWAQAGMQFEAEVTYNGTIYSLGRVNFVSVPFSLYADRAKMADSMELGDLLDVSMTPATAGQGLVWNGTAWEAATIGGGAGALNDLSDVTAAPTEAGEILVWDGTEWSVNAGTLVLDSTISTTTYLGTDLFLFGANGTANVISTFGDDPSLGLVGVVDSFDFIQGFMDVALEGEGRMGTFGPTSLNFLVGGVGTDSELGAVSVWDSVGNGKAIMGAGIPGLPSAGFIETYGSNGATNVSSVGSNTNIGYLGLADSMGTNKVIITSRDRGDGIIRTLGVDGNNAVVMGGGIDGGSGSIAVNDSTGFPRINMGVYNGNLSFLELIGPSATAEVGMQVTTSGTGIIFADVKNFRIPYPNQPGKEIWYASLEGPEAAAYVRGTATMVNGEAEVLFPAHFEAIASPQSMTVILTPLSADSEGMAVIEKTAQGFKVKELRQGTGSYSFDWEVKCVRQGYENYRAVRDVSAMPQMSTDTKAAPHGQLLPAAIARPKANVQK